MVERTTMIAGVAIGAAFLFRDRLEGFVEELGGSTFNVQEGDTIVNRGNQSGSSSSGSSETSTSSGGTSEPTGIPISENQVTGEEAVNIVSGLQEDYGTDVATAASTDEQLASIVREAERTGDVLVGGVQTTTGANITRETQEIFA